MSRRLVPVVSAAIAVALGATLVIGQSIVPLVVLAPATLVAAAILRRRPDGGDGRWVPPAAVLGPGPVPPVVHDRGSPRQVAAALGRVEARELALSGWFGAGVGLLVIGLVTIGVVYADDNGNVWRETIGLTVWFAHPLAGMVIIGVHRAVTRPARDGTAELFLACPASAPVRQGAMLRTAVVPVIAFAVFGLLYAAAALRCSPALHGPVTRDAVPVVLTGFVLVVGAVVLGVALGSWVRFALAPVVAVVGVGFVSARLATVGDPGWNWLSALSTLGQQVATPLLFPLVRPWRTLAWLVALTALVAVIARLRVRHDRRVWIAGGGTAVLALVAALVAVAPVDRDRARAVAEQIARPEAHQACSAIPGTPVEVCTYAGYGELRGRVADAVGPVARAMASRPVAVVLRQAMDAKAEDLPPEVRRQVPYLQFPAPGEIEIGFDADRHRLSAYRLLVAFEVVGIVTQPSDFGDPQVLSGQARGVVALWLAGRGMDRSDALALATVDSGEDAFEEGLAWPEMCGPVVWSAQDLDAARALLVQPEAKVLAVLEADLDRWKDASTSTDDLLIELGLSTAGPYDRILSRTESFC